MPDIERIFTIWRDCLARYGGPYLFGARRTMADAMFAPVVTRFVTYAVPLDAACSAYAKTISAMPEMREWTSAALREAEEIEELDMEF
jgi:glutathione S-transferase